jgi:hypothetical protein
MENQYLVKWHAFVSSAAIPIFCRNQIESTDAYIDKLDRVLLLKTDDSSEKQAAEIINFFFTENECECVEIVTNRLFLRRDELVAKGYCRDILRKETFVCVLDHTEPYNGDVTDIVKNIKKLVSSSNDLVVLDSDEQTNGTAIDRLISPMSGVENFTTIISLKAITKHPEFNPYMPCLQRYSADYRHYINDKDNVIYDNYELMFSLNDDIKLSVSNFNKMVEANVDNAKDRFSEIADRNIFFAVGHNISPKVMMEAVCKYPELRKAFGEPDNFLIGYLGGSSHDE